MPRLLTLLSQERIVCPLASDRKSAAIREVASLFESHPAVPDFRRFLSALFRKESRFGSGVDHGVALPHYRDTSIREPVVGLGVSSAGIDWGEGQKVHILVLVGWPEKHDNAYLQTVAEIARLLGQGSIRDQLVRATSRSAAYEVIRQDLQPRSEVS